MTTAAPRPTPGRAAVRWPWQRSLQYRIIFAYGAVFVAVLLLLSVWIGRIIYQTTLDAAVHDLEVAAFLAANALEDPLSGYRDEFDQYKAWEQEQDRSEGEREEHDDEEEGTPEDAATPLPAAGARQEQAITLPRLQQVAVTFARDSNARVTILDPAGNALADSERAIEQVSNQGQNAEFQAALLGTQQATLHPDSLTGASLLFAAAPIQQGEQMLGAVQLSRPLQEVTADARQLVLNLALAELIALALATGLAIWIGRRLVRPLRDLEEAAIAVAGGDLSHTVQVQRADEIGALAAAFNHMVGEVRTMLEQQRNFVANASHELRTPLTNIKLRSEAVRTLQHENPALAARYIAEIESEADRLTRLANELLDLARLESGETVGPPEATIDLAPMLRETVAMMELHALDAGIRLCAEIPPTLPLRVHGAEVEAVVVNLLDNAIKYTPAGGTVQLTVSQADKCIDLRIEDNGTGIPPEDRDHIFERFYRVDKARSRRRGWQRDASSGAGLGLSIAREIVERNGGQIRYEAAQVQGSVFVVSFPRVA